MLPLFYSLQSRSISIQEEVVYYETSNINLKKKISRNDFKCVQKGEITGPQWALFAIVIIYRICIAKNLDGW